MDTPLPVLLGSSCCQWEGPRIFSVREEILSWQSDRSSRVSRYFGFLWLGGDYSAERDFLFQCSSATLFAPFLRTKYKLLIEFISCPLSLLGLGLNSEGKQQKPLLLRANSPARSASVNTSWHKWTASYFFLISKGFSVKRLPLKGFLVGKVTAFLRTASRLTVMQVFFWLVTHCFMAMNCKKDFIFLFFFNHNKCIYLR